MQQTKYCQEVGSKEKYNDRRHDVLEVDGGTVSTTMTNALLHLHLTDGVTTASICKENIGASAENQRSITGPNENGIKMKDPYMCKKNVSLPYFDSKYNSPCKESIDFSDNICTHTNVNIGSLPVNLNEKIRNSDSNMYVNKHNDTSTHESFEIKASQRSKHTKAHLSERTESEQNVKQNVKDGDGKKSCARKSEFKPAIRANGVEQRADCQTLGEESNAENWLPTPSVDEATVSNFEPLMNIINKLADGQRVPPQRTMQYEMLRFCTLRSYPKENKPFITRIAQAGFYYANSGDELVCYCCARRKSNWNETDIPLEVHRQMNPNCRFLVNNSEVNVPVKPIQFLVESAADICSEHSSFTANDIGAASARRIEQVNTTEKGQQKGQQGAEPSTKIANCRRENHYSNVKTQVSSSHDNCPQNEGQADVGQSTLVMSTTKQEQQQQLLNTTQASPYAQRASSEIATGHSSFNRTQNSTVERENKKQTFMPKYPKYASKTVRLSSFSDCSGIVVPPENLAEAGFFYAGFGDCVRCFQCGLGLRHWSGTDDPWIEHSRWSKDCPFVKEMRGQEFVNLVQMAVQYSQIHDTNDTRSSTDENTATTYNDDDTEHLLHTDAAQSVLEMGYHPNVIRTAIRQGLKSNDRHQLTATKLMEIILENEDADNTQQEPLAPQGCTESKSAESSDAHKPHIEKGSGHSDSETDKRDVASSNHKEKSLNLEKKKIKEENERLKQQSICTKCKKNDVVIVFLPCGHLVTCEECAPSVKYCPIQNCGKYIKGTVRTYMA